MYLEPVTINMQSQSTPLDYRLLCLLRTVRLNSTLGFYNQVVHTTIATLDSSGTCDCTPLMFVLTYCTVQFIVSKTFFVQT